jgi:Short chain fatty acid transporter
VLGFFVPSAGGKWLIEAPYLMQSANQLHAHLGWAVQVYNASEMLPNLKSVLDAAAAGNHRLESARPDRFHLPAVRGSPAAGAVPAVAAGTDSAVSPASDANDPLTATVTWQRLAGLDRSKQ